MMQSYASAAKLRGSGPILQAIIVKADLQSSHLIGPTWLSLTAAQ